MWRSDQEDGGVLVADFSGQKLFRIPTIPEDASIGELVSEALPRMQLPSVDSQGKTISYRPRLEREGRFLFESEVASEVLQVGDRVTVLPNIDAGAY